jgi:hypothetical protein
MTNASPSRPRRVALGAALAALLSVLPVVAQGQQLPGCSQTYGCRFTYCYTAGDPPTQHCMSIPVGCYGPAPSPGLCQCPISGGSVCSPVYQAKTGAGPLSAEDLTEEGTAICHEVIRQRLGVARGVRLFDSASSEASISGEDSVRVTGTANPQGVDDAVRDSDPFALPDGAVARPFTCEAKRGETGEWTPVVIELPKTAG